MWAVGIARAGAVPVLAWLLTLNFAGAQTTSTNVARTNLPVALVWDALEKELTPKADAETAEFTFSVTNISDKIFTIDYVVTSCGCTVASLPSEPWHLAPHSNGQLTVSVDLAGKMGSFSKTVDVISGVDAVQTLIVTVHLPEGTDEARTRNQMAAMTNRQAVLQGDCARCHVESGRGKTGKELYTAVCGICHEANPRATAVPNLAALPHPTDYNFWKQWIGEGKPATMMPAFAARSGGPFDDKEIAALATTLTKLFPTGATNSPTSQRGAAPALPAGGGNQLLPQPKN